MSIRTGPRSGSALPLYRNGRAISTPSCWRRRQLQSKTGRIIPQANEEYGYEDHYPLWAPLPPGDSADTLRRTAWDIAMAGAYGTTGETARRGVGIWPDTGGGWMNGRSDDTTTMLAGYAHMVDFMTSFEWWKTEPHDELVDRRQLVPGGAGPHLCGLPAQSGQGDSVRLVPGRYNAEWFNPTDRGSNSDRPGRRSDLDFPRTARTKRLGPAVEEVQRLRFQGPRFRPWGGRMKGITFRRQCCNFENTPPSPFPDRMCGFVTLDRPPCSRKERNPWLVRTLRLIARWSSSKVLFKSCTGRSRQRRWFGCNTALLARPCRCGVGRGCGFGPSAV